MAAVGVLLRTVLGISLNIQCALLTVRIKLFESKKSNLTVQFKKYFSLGSNTFTVVLGFGLYFMQLI